MDKSSKYMMIVDWAKESISDQTFTPGDKFPSESVLCAQFGFSRQTVRRALEVLEHEGCILRRQGSGSFISGDLDAPDADSDRSNPDVRPMTVGIITTYLDQYIFPGIIRGIEEVLSKNGCSVQLALTRNQIMEETRALNRILAANPDGIIVEPTKSGLPCSNLSLYQEIQRRKIPLLFINARYPELPAPCISLDDEQAGYIATRHLLDLGHRNIGGVFLHYVQQGHLRYHGYIKALSEQGIPIREDLIFWISKENLIDFTGDRRIMDGIRDCSAVLCFNDQIALSLIEGLSEKGLRVPEDISIMGIDDCELARVASLTTIKHPMEELGRTAASTLLSMVNGTNGETILFPPVLVERTSTRRLAEEGNTNDTM